MREVLCTCGHTMSAHSASELAPAPNPMAIGLQQARAQSSRVMPESQKCEGRKAKEHPSNLEVLDRLLKSESMMEALQARCNCKTKSPCSRNLFTHDGTEWDSPLDGLRHIRWASHLQQLN